MSGKGSSRRGNTPEERKRFEEGWERIFKKPTKIVRPQKVAK